jgi:hypothetical protein
MKDVSLAALCEGLFEFPALCVSLDSWVLKPSIALDQINCFHYATKFLQSSLNVISRKMCPWQIHHSSTLLHRLQSTAMYYINLRSFYASGTQWCPCVICTWVTAFECLHSCQYKHRSQHCNTVLIFHRWRHETDCPHNRKIDNWSRKTNVKIEQTGQ